MPFYVLILDTSDPDCEPEPIGPFDDRETAAIWAVDHLAFERWWIIDIREATSPDSTAFEDPA